MVFGFEIIACLNDEFGTNCPALLAIIPQSSEKKTYLMKSCKHFIRIHPKIFAPLPCSIPKIHRAYVRLTILCVNNHIENLISLRSISAIGTWYGTANTSPRLAASIEDPQTSRLGHGYTRIASRAFKEGYPSKENTAGVDIRVYSDNTHKYVKAFSDYPAKNGWVVPGHGPDNPGVYPDLCPSLQTSSSRAFSL
jgi:hypothetical protein